MAWDNYNPYNESALGRRKPIKPKDVTIRVHIEWGGGYELGSDEDVEQWLDDVDLPDVVYIKIPREFYDDDNVGLDLSSKLSKTFDGYVQDYDYQEVDTKRIPIGARILYWRPETDIMEEF